MSMDLENKKYSTPGKRPPEDSPHSSSRPTQRRLDSPPPGAESPTSVGLATDFKKLEFGQKNLSTKPPAKIKFTLHNKTIFEKQLHHQNKKEAQETEEIDAGSGDSDSDSETDSIPLVLQKQTTDPAKDIRILKAQLSLLIGLNEAASVDIETKNSNQATIFYLEIDKIDFPKIQMNKLEGFCEASAEQKNLFNLQGKANPNTPPIIIPGLTTQPDQQEWFDFLKSKLEGLEDDDINFTGSKCKAKYTIIWVKRKLYTAIKMNLPAIILHGEMFDVQTLHKNADGTTEELHKFMFEIQLRKGLFSKRSLFDQLRKLISQRIDLLVFPIVKKVAFFDDKEELRQYHGRFALSARSQEIKDHILNTLPKKDGQTYALEAYAIRRAQ